MGKTKEKIVTEWDFEVWRELNRFTDLNYVIRGDIVQEPPKMEHENGWERLDEHLLARLAEAIWTELNRLLVRDACECVFYSVYRIVLLKCFDISRQDICVGEMGGGKTDLDVELEQLPYFNGTNSAGLARHAHGRAELSTEYMHQGRLD
jgi:hypothetical protein